MRQQTLAYYCNNTAFAEIHRVKSVNQQLDSIKRRYEKLYAYMYIAVKAML